MSLFACTGTSGPLGRVWKSPGHTCDHGPGATEDEVCVGPILGCNEMGSHASGASLCRGGTLRAPPGVGFDMKGGYFKLEAHTRSALENDESG